MKAKGIATLMVTLVCSGDYIQPSIAGYTEQRRHGQASPPGWIEPAGGSQQRDDEDGRTGERFDIDWIELPPFLSRIG